MQSIPKLGNFCPSLNLFVIFNYDTTGFFNFFIFIRPSVSNLKRRDSTLSTWDALKKALQSRGEKESVRRRSAHLANKFLENKRKSVVLNDFHRRLEEEASCKVNDIEIAKSKIAVEEDCHGTMTL